MNFGCIAALKGYAAVAKPLLCSQKFHFDHTDRS